MKKQRIALLCAALLILGMADALAGYNELVVCTDGKGIPVYTQSSGGKRAGVLYNGYWDGLSLEPTNGLYECSLTADYAVWLDEDQAGKLLPEGFYTGSRQTLYDQLPCDIFLAEVIQENAPFYTAPGHKTLTARHAPGTLVQVCGEFGDDYFVTFHGGLDRVGFMPKAALQKYADLTFRQANYSRETLGLSDARKATVHTQGGPITAAASATGYTGIGPTVLENGQEVTVLRERDGWAQLSGGCFLEGRFLDPEGDHAVSYATVKTSGPLNRLNVRGYPSADAWVVVKLCAGAQVQLASHTDDWPPCSSWGREAAWRIPAACRCSTWPWATRRSRSKAAAYGFGLLKMFTTSGKAIGGSRPMWTRTSRSRKPCPRGRSLRCWAWMPATT